MLVASIPAYAEINTLEEALALAYQHDPGLDAQRGADLGVRAIFDHLDRATRGAAVRRTEPRAQACAARHTTKNAESDGARNMAGPN